MVGERALAAATALAGPSRIDFPGARPEDPLSEGIACRVVGFLGGGVVVRQRAWDRSEGPNSVDDCLHVRCSGPLSPGCRGVETP